MDCSSSGSSVHGIFQARVLEWITNPFSKRSSWPRDRTQSPTLQADSLSSELARKPHQYSWLKSTIQQLLKSKRKKISWGAEMNDGLQKSLLWVHPSGEHPKAAHPDHKEALQWETVSAISHHSDWVSTLAVLWFWVPILPPPFPFTAVRAAWQLEAPPPPICSHSISLFSPQTTPQINLLHPCHWLPRRPVWHSCWHMKDEQYRSTHFGGNS